MSKESRICDAVGAAADERVRFVDGHRVAGEPQVDGRAESTESGAYDGDRSFRSSPSIGKGNTPEFAGGQGVEFFDEGDGFAMADAERARADAAVQAAIDVDTGLDGDAAIGREGIQIEFGGR